MDCVDIHILQVKMLELKEEGIFPGLLSQTGNITKVPLTAEVQLEVIIDAEKRHLCPGA